MRLEFYSPKYGRWYRIAKKKKCGRKKSIYKKCFKMLSFDARMLREMLRYQKSERENPQRCENTEAGFCPQASADS